MITMAANGIGPGLALLLVILAIVRKSGGSSSTPAPQARSATGGRTRRKVPPPPARWAPVTAAEVVDRALAQRGRGRYHMGGGAIYTAEDVYAPEGNNHPGATDCTGLLAFAGKYRRGRFNTDGIVDDAKGPQAHFMIVPDDEPVRAGDFLVTDKGHDLQDHAGVIVEVLPGFVRHGQHWYRDLRVAQAAGQSWTTIPEHMEDHTGAVRVTDAYRWRHTGVIIRPLHVED